MSAKKSASPSLTIEHRIRALLSQSTPGEKSVSRAVLAAYPIAALGTIAELSQRANVSAPTILRWTSKLGFDGYSHFQRAVQEEIQEKMQSPLSLMDSAQRSPSTKRDFFGKFVDDTIAALQRTRQLLDGDVLEETCQQLADPSKRIFAMGGRSSHVLAKHIVFHLHQIRSQVQEVSTSPVPVYHQANDMGRNSLIVVFDFRRYERQTIEFCQQAAKRGAKLILITDPWLSPIAEVASWVLPVEVDVPSPFDSSISSLTVVEAMMAGTLARLGGAAKERMTKLEEISGPDKVIGGGEPIAQEREISIVQKAGRTKHSKKRR